MRLNKPVKRFALGWRTVSKWNRSFNTIFFICRESWNSMEEAKEYCAKNPNWKHGEHSMSTIMQLTDAEIAYNNL